MKKVKFCISKIDGKEIRIKDEYQDFQNYLSSLVAKHIDIEGMKSRIIESLPDLDKKSIKLTTYEGVKILGEKKNFSNNDITNDLSIDLQVTNEKFRIEINPGHNKFIDNKMNEMIVMMNEVERYTGKNVVGLLYLYMLQPIKIYNGDLEIDYINIFLWVYSNGNIIVQYTVPVIDATVSNFTRTEEIPFNIEASLPKYIHDNKYKDEYIYNDKKIAYKDAIMII